MNYGRIEQITLKGANTDGGEYVTDTVLEGYSSYKEFKGLWGRSFGRRSNRFGSSHALSWRNPA